MFNEDLSVFFQVDGFAKTATWNGQTTAVFLDEPDAEIFTGEEVRVVAAQKWATMPTAVWPGIGRNAQVVIEGVTYKVREVHQLKDGALKRLVLGT